MKILRFINNAFIFAAIIIMSSCEWPFNTTPTTDDTFEIAAKHYITRIMPSAEIDLTWNEITVENFKSFKIERIRTNDTSWTAVIELTDPFQLSYTDTIWDDEDLIYRIGISDLDDNILWATTPIGIPRTTSVSVSGEFETIQPAFDSDLIDDGDTIIVQPDIYQETLEIGGKDVLIRSLEGFQSTILMPTDTDNYNLKKRVIDISSGVLDGFTIEQGAPSWGARGGGVAITQNGTVRNCYITANRSESDGGGVTITNNGNMYNNILFNNNAASGSGIFITYAHGEIINNSIVDDDVVINGDCTGLIFRNNIVYNSLPDIDISFSSPADTAGIIIDYLLLDSDIGIGTAIILADPLFDNFIDFKLAPTSPCINAGHPADQYRDFDGSRNDIGAYGGPESKQ